MVRKRTGSTDGEGADLHAETAGTEPPMDPRSEPRVTDAVAETPDDPAAWTASPWPAGAPGIVGPAAATPPESATESPTESAEDAALLDAVDDAIEASESEPPARPEPISEEPAREPVAAAPEPAAETHDEPHAEEGGGFASRLLTALLLLIVGAGLAIWGAPKLAPMLPSGMAPVAGWLTPGSSQAETRIAALESRLDTDLGSVRAQVADLTGPTLDTRIGTALSASEARIGGDIGGLREQIGQLDGADTRQRLARLESAIDGQTAELATLKEQISGGAAAAGASEEAVARIDVYRAELDGLRAEVGTLNDAVATLGARIDEVAAEADRQVETAQATVEQVQTEASTAVSAATLKSDLAMVEAAMAAGQPFAEPLERLAADPGVTIPPALTAAAGTGIVSLASLRDGFSDAAHAAIRASILAGAGEGVLARSRAFVSAQVASRSLTPRAGPDPDAVLSRMEDKLRQDDIPGALAEADQLPSEAAAAMGGWLDAARLRADAEAGLSTLTAELPATN